MQVTRSFKSTFVTMLMLRLSYRANLSQLLLQSDSQEINYSDSRNNSSGVEEIFSCGNAHMALWSHTLSLSGGKRVVPE